MLDNIINIIMAFLSFVGGFFTGTYVTIVFFLFHSIIFSIFLIFICDKFFIEDNNIGGTGAIGAAWFYFVVCGLIGLVLSIVFTGFIF